MQSTIAKTLDLTLEKFINKFNEDFSSPSKEENTQQQQPQQCHPITFMKRLKMVEMKLQELQTKIKQIEHASQELALISSTTAHETKGVLTDVIVGKYVPELQTLLTSVERYETPLWHYARLRIQNSSSSSCVDI
jgi:hypothetical protein